MRLKRFVGHATIVGRRWAEAGIQTPQIDVFAYAANRADLDVLCAEVGDRTLARQLVHPTARSTVQMGFDWEAFTRATEPVRGVYLTTPFVRGPVLRVEPGGTFTTIGHFVRDRDAHGQVAFIPHREEST